MRQEEWKSAFSSLHGLDVPIFSSCADSYEHQHLEAPTSLFSKEESQKSLFADDRNFFENTRRSSTSLFAEHSQNRESLFFDNHQSSTSNASATIPSSLSNFDLKSKNNSNNPLPTSRFSHLDGSLFNQDQSHLNQRFSDRESFLSSLMAPYGVNNPTSLGLNNLSTIPPPKGFENTITRARITKNDDQEKPMESVKKSNLACVEEEMNSAIEETDINSTENNYASSENCNSQVDQEWNHAERDQSNTLNANPRCVSTTSSTSSTVGARRSSVPDRQPLVRSASVGPLSAPLSSSSFPDILSSLTIGTSIAHQKLPTSAPPGILIDASPSSTINFKIRQYQGQIRETKERLNMKHAQIESIKLEIKEDESIILSLEKSITELSKSLHTNDSGTSIESTGNHSFSNLFSNLGSYSEEHQGSGERVGTEESIAGGTGPSFNLSPAASSSSVNSSVHSTSHNQTPLSEISLKSTGIDENFCRKYNRLECIKEDCVYSHQCINCGGTHPRMHCTSTEKISSTNSPVSTTTGASSWAAAVVSSVKERSTDCLKNEESVRTSTSEVVATSSIYNRFHFDSFSIDPSITSPPMSNTVVDKKEIFEAPTVEPCLKWNFRECSWGEKCHRTHVCVHCGSAEHRGPRCDGEKRNSHLDRDSDSTKNFENLGTDICVSWNNGTCRMGERCKRSHCCLKCGSSAHAAKFCTTKPELSTSPQHSMKSYSKSRAMNDANGEISKQDTSTPPILNSSFASKVASDSNNPNPIVVNASQVVKVEAELSDDYAEDDDQYNESEDAYYYNRTNRRASWDYSEVCFNYNNGRCQLSASKCRRSHECSVCSSPNHPAVECDAEGYEASDFVDGGLEVCLNWNSGRCGFGSEEDRKRRLNAVQKKGPASNLIGQHCKRLHACLVCLHPDHSSQLCPSEQSVNVTSDDGYTKKDITSTRTGSSSLNKIKDPSSVAYEICMNWNNQRCRVERCKRMHICSICRQHGHIASSCTNRGTSSSTGEAPESDYMDEVCMNWNSGRCRMGKKCKRSHVCSCCFREGHTHRECTAAK